MKEAWPGYAARLTPLWDRNDRAGRHDYARALERGLPRWDGRSPALKAKQERAAREAAAKLRQVEIDAARARAETKQALPPVTPPVAGARRRDRAREIAESAGIEREKAAMRARLDALATAPPSLAHGLRVADIVAVVAAEWALTPADILDPSRNARVVLARREAMATAWLLRPDLSLPRIGRLLGGRDHTTVLHALRRAGVWPRQGRPA